MVTTLLAVGTAVIVWGVVSRPLARARLSGPLLMLIAGLVVGFTVTDRVGLSVFINSQNAQKIAEIVLAILLFVDATEVRYGAMKRSRRAVLALLFIAMPISLGLALLAGIVLLPELNLAVLLALACIVVPVDFSPLTSIVRDERIPQRLRHILNIESGYNDGVVAPLFLVALAMSGDRSHGGPLSAIQQALPAALLAVVVGLFVGYVLAVLSNVGSKRGWFSEQSMRIGLVAVPLLTYGLSVGVGGNGFVAAFVAGTVFRMFRRSATIRAELSLAEDISVINNLGLWFVLGASIVFISVIVDNLAATLLYVFLALALVRLGPVMLSLWRSGLSLREKVLLGTLGPRGTASVVFGLLAFNAIPDDSSAYAAMAVTILTVGGSMLVHGVGAPLILTLSLGRTNRGSAISHSD